MKTPAPQHVKTHLPFHILSGCFERGCPKVISVRKTPFDKLVSYSTTSTACIGHGGSSLCMSYLPYSITVLSYSILASNLFSVHYCESTLKVLNIYLFWTELSTKLAKYGMNLCSYYLPELRRMEYWGLIVFLLQYSPLVNIRKLLHDNWKNMNI